MTPIGTEPAQAGPPALLLVDDELAFMQALSFRLETRGLPCLCATSGEEALSLLRSPELEVVLLDLGMPGLHGLETLPIIKEVRPDVEVILLTGEANLATAAKGMRRGAGDYLVKPVDFKTLLESIDKARQRSREHKERLRALEAGKLMALGTLAAGVGHEINNPLQIIVQRSEWLDELLNDAESGSGDFQEMRKTATVIQAQARRCGAITAQLLDLAHKTRSSTAESDLSSLVEKNLGQLAERAELLGVVCETRFAPELPLLPCSPVELEPVLMHLLRNALDSIEALPVREERAKGTEERQARHSIRIGADMVGTFVRLVIADTGQGIAPEDLPRIFEPFFSTRPVGKGTGLGLTVSHSIITALGGSIRHVASPSGGATFVVEIPWTGPGAKK